VIRSYWVQRPEEDEPEFRKTGRSKQVRLLLTLSSRLDMSVSKGSLRVSLDDRYDFDRSALSHMGRWRTDLLDMQTAARWRSLWFGSGEWRIWLTYRVR